MNGIKGRGAGGIQSDTWSAQVVNIGDAVGDGIGLGVDRYNVSSLIFLYEI